MNLKKFKHPDPLLKCSICGGHVTSDGLKRHPKGVNFQIGYYPYKITKCRDCEKEFYAHYLPVHIAEIHQDKNSIEWCVSPNLKNEQSIKRPKRSQKSRGNILGKYPDYQPKAQSNSKLHKRYAVQGGLPSLGKKK